MTIETDKNFIRYTSDGVTAVYSYDFLVTDALHMFVTVENEPYEDGYTVDGINDPNGGTVTLTGAIPADGLSISLVRIVPIDQLVDYRPYDAFPAETHEGALDKLTMIAQQQQEVLDRAIVLPPGQDPDTIPTFPEYDSGKLIGWSETVPNELENAPYAFQDIIDQADRAETEANNSASSASASASSASASATSAGESATSASNALASEELAEKWANEDEDIPVEPGEFSAFHWAQKASKAIDAVDITTSTPDTLQVTQPTEANFDIVTLSNQANALCKLDSDGRVPSELLPFSGLQFYGPFNAEPLVGDADNPSLRFPGVTWSSGNWVLITSAGFALAVDVNDTGAGEQALPVAEGDGLVYYPGSTEPLLPQGWFRVEEIIAGDIITASSVVFDDTSTVIKGTNVQVFNEAMDLQVEANKTLTESNLASILLKADITALDAHVTNLSNPHGVTAEQAGADPVGSADAVQDNVDILSGEVSGHIANTNNPHGTTASDVGAPASVDVTAIVKLTQAEYDALTPDATTMYLIVG